MTGFGADVEHAARLNIYETVPHMRDHYFAPFDPTGVADDPEANHG
jgi:hypothetical protein